MKQFFTQLTLSGPRAIKFCHDYTVSSLSEDDTGTLVPTAFLNKKGRVITTALLCIEDYQRVSIVISKEVYPALMSHLDLYLKFSRVDFEVDTLKKDISDHISYEGVINAPFPWIGSLQSGLYTVSDLSLDILNWVDFNKGCYLGQEIVSRMHFKVKERKKYLAVVNGGHCRSVLPVCYQDTPRTLAVLTNDSSGLSESSTVHQVWDKVQ